MKRKGTNLETEPHAVATCRLSTFVLMLAAIAICGSHTRQIHAALACEQGATQQSAGSKTQLLSDPMEIPELEEFQIISPQVPGDGQHFGFGVSMSSGLLAVGVGRQSDLGHGAVEIHKLQDGAWQHHQTLISPYAESGPTDGFFVVSMTNDHLLVGDYDYCPDDKICDVGSGAGAAYVYSKTADGEQKWSLVKQLRSSVASDTRFGLPAVMDGTTAAIRSEDFNGAKAISIFEKDQGGPNEWGQVKRLKPPSAEVAGTILDIFGDTLLVYRFSADGPDSVYVYQRDEGGSAAWGLLQEISTSCDIIYDFAIDGNTLVLVVSTREQSAADRLSGLVFFGKNEQGNWERVFELDTPFRLRHVDLDGNRLLVSARTPDDVGFILERVPGTSNWEYRYRLTASSPVADQVYSSVALNTGQAVVAYTLIGPTDRDIAYAYRLGPDFINAGINDAWVSEGAPFQGFFFTVYPELKIFFLAWFTFDLVPPESDVAAIFGAADQRWVTASGGFTGNTASLKAELTSGGMFNASEPLATQMPNYGTMTVNFIDCGEAIVAFDFPALELSGQFTVTRVIPSNEALCMALSGAQ